MKYMLNNTDNLSADVLKAIDDSGIDATTRARVKDHKEIPGAHWHIYHANEADKIRDLLNKVLPLN